MSPFSAPGSPRDNAPLLATVLDRLGKEIVSGELAEGRTFTLQYIGDTFGTSRTVAREAMRALEQLGLVSASRRVGLTVLPRTSWAVFDPTLIAWRLKDDREREPQLRALTELRIAVEPIAAFNAAQSATNAQRAELSELAAHLRRLGSRKLGATEEFLKVDIRFHALLLNASGNDMFAALTPPMAEALRGRTRLSLQPETPTESALSAHERLARCVAASDGSAAEDASRDLLAEVREALHP